MESIERLRKMDDGMLVPLGNGQYVPDHSHNDIADQIEAEIAERYMELPTDADGVPIHVGDEMQYHGGEPFIVCAVAPCVIHTWVEAKLGERMTTYDYKPLQCTHYKPRTVEDVLRELVECVRDERGGQLDDGDIEGFAGEIRGLL